MKPTKQPATKQPAKQAGTSLTKAPKGELVKGKSESIMAMAMADEGMGQENMTTDDLAIPRLVLLQSNSKQVKKGSPDRITDAEEGMIFDGINGHLWDGEKGVELIPVSYRRTHIEWKQRDAGGGFVADHGSDTSILSRCTKDDKGRNLLPNGNQIVPTAEYFVMVLNETGGVTPYVLSMSSSQLRESRRWNSMMNTLRVPRPDGNGDFNPAMFFRTYTLTTVPKQNDQGSWMSWKVEPTRDVLDLPNGERIYLACRQLRLDIDQGKVTAKPPVDADHDGGGDDDSPM